jgi:hypothetical protein
MPRGGRTSGTRIGNGKGHGGERAGAGWGGEAKGASVSRIDDGPVGAAIRALGHDPEHMAEKAARAAVLDANLFKLALTAEEEVNQIRASVAALARLDPVPTKQELTGANGEPLAPPVINIIGVKPQSEG